MPGEDDVKPEIVFPTPLHTIIKSIRKYDGTTRVEDWVRLFELDLQTNKLDHAWAINNLDRFLEKDAANWWSSRKYPFIDSNEAEKSVVWIELKLKLQAFFGSESAKKAAKERNKEITYNTKLGAQSYVTQKISVLSVVNPEMTEEKIIEHLIKGLPSHLKIHMKVAMSSDSTIEDFLGKLIKLTEDEHTKTPAEEAHSSHNTYPSHSTHSRKTHTFNNIQSNIHTTDPEEHGQRSQAFMSKQALYQYTDNNGRKICTECNRAGHVRKDCFFNPRSPNYRGVPFNPRHNPNANQPQQRFQNYNAAPYNYQTSRGPPNHATQDPQAEIQQLSQRLNELQALQNTYPPLNQ